MGDLKLRAWIPSLKKMVYADFWDRNWYSTEENTRESCNTFCPKHDLQYRSIVMRGIGSADSAGKNIYDGDTYEDKRHGKRVIEWSNSQSCFMSLLVSDKELGNPLSFENKSEILITGNIYQ